MSERIITIKGEKDQLIATTDRIIDIVKDDPQSGSCPNISYSNVNTPLPNADPTGSPYATNVMATDVSTSTVPQTLLYQPIVPQTAPFIQQTAAGLQYIQQGQIAQEPFQQLIGGYPYSIVLQPQQFHQRGIQALAPAHNFIPVAHGNHLAHAGQQIVIPQHGDPLGQAARLSIAPQQYQLATATPQPAQQTYLQTTQQQMTSSLISMTSSAPTQLTSLQQYQATPVTSQAVVTAGSATPQAAAAQVVVRLVQHQQGIPHDTMEVAVDEDFIGAVLGQRGKTLTECQTQSNTKIQISKKGEFYRGTRDRKVVITGSGHGVAQAWEFVKAKVAQTQRERQQQQQMTASRIHTPAAFC